MKLLDFGLAKAMAPAAAQSGATSFPTMAGSVQNLTEAGTILGTFQYMSPEQLEGKEADSRSDIFAFGAVLYEMATGKKAFSGSSQASLIGSILRDDPTTISEIVPMMPPAFNRVVKTCLAKDPENRFQTAHDVKLQLQWIAEGGSLAGVPAPVVARRRSRERLAWTVTAVALVAAAGLGAVLLLAPKKTERVFRSALPPPEGTSFWLSRTVRALPSSPRTGGRSRSPPPTANGKFQLYVRSLDAIEARVALRHGRGPVPLLVARQPLARLLHGRKAEDDRGRGGAPLTLCGAPEGKGGTWSPAGVIVFRREPDAPGSSRYRTRGRSGCRHEARREARRRLAPAPAVPPGREALPLRRPEPAGRGRREPVIVASLDGGAEKVLLRSPAAAIYASGHLLYLREATLMARPFDTVRLSFTGDAAPVAEGILMPALATSIGVFSASQNGVLVYQTARGQLASALQWYTRDGKLDGTLGEPADYGEVVLSPDGKQAAVTILDAATGRTTSGSSTSAAACAPASRSTRRRPVAALVSDGAALVFSSNRKGHYDLYRKALDGSAEEEALLASDADTSPVSRRRKLLLFTQARMDTGVEVQTLPLEGGRKPEPCRKSKFNEITSPLSPDGRWAPYSSEESGRWEVYVTSFPRAGRKWQVSAEGGAYAFWSADGREIIYHDLAGCSVSRGRGARRDSRGRPGPAALPGPRAEPRGLDVLADVGPPAVPRRRRGAEAERAPGPRRELDDREASEMTLAPSTKPGLMSVISALGAGGMGEGLSGQGHEAGDATSRSRSCRRKSKRKRASRDSSGRRSRWRR